MNDSYNIFSDSSQIDISILNLNDFLLFLDDYSSNVAVIFNNLHKVEHLIDTQFFYCIDTSNNSFNYLQEKLKLLEKVISKLKTILEGSVGLSPRSVSDNKEKLNNLTIKISSYKLFYEQRTSRNLATNIANISDFNTKKGLALLGSTDEKYISFTEEFGKLKKGEFNKSLFYAFLFRSILFILFCVVCIEISRRLQVELRPIVGIILLLLILSVTHSKRKTLGYDRFKEILVNTYRFSSISQRLFYINETPGINKIKDQKELVEYYDMHLEKEQNRQVKYGYAKKLFTLLMLESVLLFLLFGFLLYKFGIDKINTIADLLKWIFGLTLGQIASMVLIIVKYLFYDNQKNANIEP